MTATSGGPGRGSEFTVHLPALAAAPAAQPAAADEPTARSGKRVLVVDDNQDSAELLAESLGELGYQVAVALDGVAALDRLRDFRADAAVLDLGLPVMDGFELARRIQDGDTPRPRLIALTGYGQAHDRERTSRAGFDAHLVKPVDVAAVVAELERAG